MSQTTLSVHPLTRTAVSLAPKGSYLVGGAIVFAAAAIIVPDARVGLIFASTAGTLAALAFVIRWLSSRHGKSQSTLHEQIAGFILHDASPSFSTSADGEIGYQNRAALERFGSRAGQTMTRALGDVMANPGAVLHRLQVKAASIGAAREDLVTRRGHVRLAVHQVSGGGFLWRLEDMAERVVGGRGADSISLPMLTVSKSGTILFMNEALRVLVGERVKSMDRLFSDLPLRPGDEHELMTVNGPVRTLVAEVEGSAGRQEIYLLPGAVGARSMSADPTSFDALPVALMRLTGEGEVIASNRAARALLGDVAEGAELSALFEGLGRPVNDWLADAISGRADRKPEVLQVSHPEKEVFPAGDPGTGQRKRAGGADRCPVGRDAVENARSAVRAKPEDAGDRPACRRCCP